MITKEEYLSFEREGQVRHEWVGGQMWMMTGGSGRHNRISLQLASSLLGGAKAHGCRVYMADMKVVTDVAGYYPDVMVVCQPDAPDDYYEESPCLIVEVLSPSTHDRDRREKWAVYKTIGSLRHFLLVRQDDTQIEHWFRLNEGSPWQHELLGPDDEVHLTCPEMSFVVGDVYAGL